MSLSLVEIRNHYRFDYTEMFTALKSYIDSYNERHCILKTRINASQRATIEVMLRLYLKQLNEAGKTGIYSLKTLPAFATYNSSLAKLKGCTTRTLINHRVRLREAGLIVKEELHGRDGVKIWVNPYVIWKAAYGGEKGKFGGTQYCSIWPKIEGNMKKIHPLLHVHYINNNSSVDNVENFMSAEVDEKDVFDMSGLPIGNALQDGDDKHTKKNACMHEASSMPIAESSSHEPLKKGSKDFNAVPRKMQPCSSPSNHEKEDEGGRIFKLNLVREAWAYAKKTLFTELPMDVNDEKTVLNHVYRSVYKGFTEDVNKSEWLQYQQAVMDRIDMVKKWLDKSPFNWIPLPEIYFHPSNHVNGFRNTWKWYLKRETLRLQVQNRLLLQRCKMELNEHQQNKGAHVAKSRFELFKYHRKQLARVGDEALNTLYLKMYHRNIELKAKLG